MFLVDPVTKCTYYTPVIRTFFPIVLSFLCDGMHAFLCPFFVMTCNCIYSEDCDERHSTDLCDDYGYEGGDGIVYMKYNSKKIYSYYF